MLIYSCFSCSCLFLFELLNLCGVISTSCILPLRGCSMKYVYKLSTNAPSDSLLLLICKFTPFSGLVWMEMS